MSYRTPVQVIATPYPFHQPSGLPLAPMARTGTPGTSLSERELHVLELIADGHGNADIARTLDCSQHTVKNVIYDLMARLQLRNRAHAAAYAVRSGLI